MALLPADALRLFRLWSLGGCHLPVPQDAVWAALLWFWQPSSPSPARSRPSNRRHPSRGRAPCRPLSDIRPYGVYLCLDEQVAARCSLDGTTSRSPGSLSVLSIPALRPATYPTGAPPLAQQCGSTTARHGAKASHVCTCQDRRAANKLNAPECGDRMPVSLAAVPAGSRAAAQQIVIPAIRGRAPTSLTLRSLLRLVEPCLNVN